MLDSFFLIFNVIFNANLIKRSTTSEALHTVLESVPNATQH